MVAANSPVVLIVSKFTEVRSVGRKEKLFVVTVLRVLEFAVFLFPGQEAEAIGFAGELREATVTAMTLEGSWKKKNEG